MSTIYTYSMGEIRNMNNKLTKWRLTNVDVK